jgi:hypothetical protein
MHFTSRWKISADYSSERRWRTVEQRIPERQKVRCGTVSAWGISAAGLSVRWHQQTEGTTVADSIRDKIENAGEAVKDAARKAGEKTADAAKAAGQAAKDAGQKLKDKSGT